jgi:galacturan 1,4-alpha-galacturonidase
VLGSLVAADGRLLHFYTTKSQLTLSRGIVENITFENFYIEGANIGMAISQNSGDNGSYAGTSKMLVSNVLFKNFTGYEYGAKGNRTASITCSKVNPCHDIVFEDINLAYSQNA